MVSVGSGLTDGAGNRPPYLSATHGGVSPYGPKACIRNWSAEEKRNLTLEVEKIVMRVCVKHGISWVQVYGSSRSKARDACRQEVIRTVCHELNVAPAIVARVFSCHQATVMQALKGKRRPAGSCLPPNAELSRGDGSAAPQTLKGN